MGLWTRVRLPPIPLLVVRRDLRSGRMPYHLADTHERSSYRNVSAPLLVVRKDPRSGSFLITNIRSNRKEEVCGGQK